MSTNESISTIQSHDSHISDETEFLEKYLHDIIMDQCSNLISPSIYTTLSKQVTQQKQLDTILQRYIQEQIALQQKQKVHHKYFFSLIDMKIGYLISQINLIFQNLDVSQMSTASRYTPRKQQAIEFIEIYHNDHQQQFIKQGELIYIDTKLKITSQKLKSEIHDILSKITKQIKSRDENIEGIDDNFQDTFKTFYQNSHKSITIILFVNADLNFNYSDYFNVNQLQIDRITYNLRIKVIWISKCRLLNRFCDQYNIQNDYITSQRMAFYELERYGQNKIIINQTIEKIRKSQQRKQMIIQNIKKSVIGLGLVIGAIGTSYFLRKQIINEIKTLTYPITFGQILFSRRSFI